LLLEAFSEASRALEILVDTPKDTALLTGDQGLGGEVVDAVVKATLDEPGVHLQCEVEHQRYGTHKRKEKAAERRTQPLPT
jgi:hypothetical protein